MLNNFLVGDGLNAPFGRTGGKKLLKKKIVDKYFPKNYEDLIYVEPFIGAGSVFFYKNPSIKEIINDLDKNIYILFKGFQKYDGNKISNDINGFWTKEDFNKTLNSNPKKPYNIFIKTLLLVKQSFFNNFISYDKPSNSKGISTNYKNKISERLKNTIILNKDYKKLIDKYDSPNTFFYLDPPYENSTNLYEHDTLPIEDIFNSLKNIKGYFLLSYNDSKKAKELFKDFKISYIKTKYVIPTVGGHTRIKKEMLIRNYT